MDFAFSFPQCLFLYVSIPFRSISFSLAGQLHESICLEYAKVRGTVEVTRVSQRALDSGIYNTLSAIESQNALYAEV